MTGEATFAENMVILGGTGRFAGAEGSAFDPGWFDPDTGYVEIVGDGVIQYDASMRTNDQNQQACRACGGPVGVPQSTAVARGVRARRSGLHPARGDQRRIDPPSETHGRTTHAEPARCSLRC